MDLADALTYCREHHHSILIARKADGSPQPSPVVHGVNADGHLVISSREPAYKVRNLRRDPRVRAEPVEAVTGIVVRSLAPIV